MVHHTTSLPWIGRVGAAMLAILLAPMLALGPAPPGADAPATVGVDTRQPGDCGHCHFCSQPTSQDPCLYEPCTRRAHIAADDPAVPTLIVLNKIEDVYAAVPYDHRGHARMAAMGDGCATCHHHSPSGRLPPACDRCHDPRSSGTDIQKPGLKGAYHQQCLNCHRDWIDETACKVCHVRKDSDTADATTAPVTKDDVLGRMHPPIPRPEGPLYTSSSTDGAPRVVFRHAKHIDSFGLRCVDCHHERHCARCHQQRGEPRRPTLVEHHRPCLKCHRKDMDLAGRAANRCTLCHWLAGQPEPAPFNHADVGWPLSRFHDAVPCRDCHRTVPFEAPDRQCAACHVAWTPGTFDHALTGQLLDATHADMDCGSCHPENRFDVPPVCGACHDAEEGIAFPARRPGPVVKVTDDGPR